MNPIQVLLLGLSLGSIYALLALGFVTIYKGTRVFNLAQGSVMLFGVYVIYLVAPPIGFLAACLVGVLVAGALSVVIYAVVALAKTDDHLVLTILTIGIDLVILTELSRSIGTSILNLDDPWGSDTVLLLGVTLPVARIWAAGMALSIIGLFFFLLQRTTFGVEMRASSADPQTAALMGISQRKVALVSWLIGGSLAAVAGIFLAVAPNSGLDGLSSFVAFNAIPAIMIGGLDSTGGAVIGGLIVGVGQMLFTGFASSLLFLGHSFGDVAPWVIMIVVLLIRPRGLFGSREVARV